MPGMGSEIPMEQSRGQGGGHSPLAELRGGSLLSGCRGEAPGAGRGQGPAQSSDENRHLILGIACRTTIRFFGFQEAGKFMFFQNGERTVHNETHKT